MTAFALPFFLAALTLHWTPQVSNTTASLRGLSVVSAKVAWTSGSKGTVLRTLDGGEHWESRAVPKIQALDFRDIVAFDGKAAVLMSVGTGDASRVYVTADGGEHWKLALSNPDATGFFDSLKFWDRKNGILLGDPVAGHFTIFRTSDGGLTWVKGGEPKALENEGAFAASGTCLTLRGNQEAWFGTGGPGGGRVFHSTDRGADWTVSPTPLSGTVAAAGIFSLVFIDSMRGIAVGGDYLHPAITSHTLAVTEDGGRTWTAPDTQLGFRSAITCLKYRKLLLAAGTSGSDFSSDGGRSWKQFSTDNVNALAVNGRSVWAVGPKGVILQLSFGP